MPQFHHRVLAQTKAVNVYAGHLFARGHGLEATGQNNVFIESLDTVQRVTTNTELQLHWHVILILLEQSRHNFHRAFKCLCQVEKLEVPNIDGSLQGGAHLFKNVLPTCDFKSPKNLRETVSPGLATLPQIILGLALKLPL